MTTTIRTRRAPTPATTDSPARAVLDSAISEKQFQANVVRLAKLHRWLCYHTHDSRHSEPGFPDLVLCRDGVLIFAELKRQTGRVSPAQREWMQHLSLVAGIVGASGVHGAIQVYLWKPADWQTIERVLSGGSDGRTAKGAA